jgi:hypothetical protein
MGVRNLKQPTSDFSRTHRDVPPANLHHEFKFLVLPDNNYSIVGARICSYIHVTNNFKNMPKVTETPFMVGMNGKDVKPCGTILRYEDIEPELLITPETPKLTRVLPAQFFYEKRLFFFLIRKYEPGEKASFPKGGFEVRDEGGALRSFELDQVIIHPQVIKHQKTLEKMARRAEKEQAKRERKSKKNERNREKIERQKKSGGRRGRPALDPVEKARREAEKVTRAQKSGGKRGRPKGTGTPKAPKAPKPAGTGKRGRPALSAEAIATRVAARAQVKARSGGKRGRPKKR